MPGHWIKTIRCVKNRKGYFSIAIIFRNNLMHLETILSKEGQKVGWQTEKHLIILDEPRN